MLRVSYFIFKRKIIIFLKTFGISKNYENFPKYSKLDFYILGKIFRSVENRGGACFSHSPVPESEHFLKKHWAKYVLAHFMFTFIGQNAFGPNFPKIKTYWFFKEEEKNKLQICLVFIVLTKRKKWDPHLPKQIEERQGDKQRNKQILRDFQIQK